MNIDQLKYFADLSKTNSITNTAKRMFISQQALSESIKRLENEVGCTLVTRSKTGIEFTDDGKLILDYAQKILVLHTEMEQELQNKYNKEFLRGKLSIGVGPTVSNVFLPKLMLKMHQLYPSIKLHILESPRETILSLLHTSELDFGIFGIFTDENSEININSLHKRLAEPYISDKLQFLELYRDPMVCVMSKNHPLSTEPHFTRAQLQDVPQTHFSSDIAALNSAACINSLCISTNATIHQQFMLEESMVCCMPYQAYISQFDEKNFIGRPVIDYPSVINYLIYRKSVLDDHELLYTRFMETAQSLAAQL